MAKCHCGRVKHPEAPNCGEVSCLGVADWIESERAYRTWRYKMILLGNDFVELSKQRFMKNHAVMRRVRNQILHENLLRQYQRLRIEDRLAEEES